MNIHARKLAQLRWGNTKVQPILTRRQVQPPIRVNINGKFSKFISLSRSKKIADNLMACSALIGYAAFMVFACSAVQFILA